MTLEEGFTALADDGENHWELGGLEIEVTGDGDDGLDDVAELEGEDQNAAGDGSVAGDQRLASRPIQLMVRIAAPDGTASDATAAAFAASLDAIRTVMSPLPDRTATRWLRWRRAGEPPKRIAVRPAKGKPMSIPGDWRRLVNDHADATLRLEAPDPIVLSDEYHTHTFSGAGSATIAMAGTFQAVQPMAWWLTADDGVTIACPAFNESVTFPAGPLTVTRNREIDADGQHLAHGPGSTIFPRWPLLRPGNNTITASGPCVFSWRDTW